MKHEQLPLIFLKNTIVLPYMTNFLMIGKEESLKSLNKALYNSGHIIIMGGDINTIPSRKLLRFSKQYGTLCEIISSIGDHDRGHQVLVKGISRFLITKIEISNGLCTTTGEEKRDKLITTKESSQSFLTIKLIAKDIIKLLPRADDVIIKNIEKIKEQDELVYTAASLLKLDANELQKIIEEPSMHKKMLNVIDLLKKEREVLLLDNDIKDKVTKNISKHQKKEILKEQLAVIREELGQNFDRNTELETKIQTSKMPKKVKEIARKELSRINDAQTNPSEFFVIENYIDWLCSLPWSQYTKDVIDLEKAQEILDKSHFDLPKVKNRILEYLAVKKLHGYSGGEILCFVGPPGVGKTSLGKSIAKSLNRKFANISLAGLHDSAEIKGHIRTYVGAMPGKIIKCIKDTDVNNPVILLDEIDKMGTGPRSDPSSTLLEVLDPGQNIEFHDNYLGVPFDLSNVFFIATANLIDDIPVALRDRMEIIEISSYAIFEKKIVASKYLLPSLIKKHGLSKNSIKITPKNLEFLITSYTRESGLREITRVLASICRSVALQAFKNKKEPPHIIDANSIQNILGPPKYGYLEKDKQVVSGMALGLAWTPFGGEVLHVETVTSKGRGVLKLTGQLGSVMKESADVALSYIKSKIDRLPCGFDFREKDIHIHVPAGAVPKDGPSAGITIATALASLICNKCLDPKIAMTGEMSLGGLILPVGGIKEKILAAHRYGITNVILPEGNRKDLYDIPQEVLNSINIYYVFTFDQILAGIFKVDLTEEVPPVDYEKMIHLPKVCTTYLPANLNQGGLIEQ